MSTTWSPDDLVRAIERMEQTLKEMRSDQKAANDRMVPRETWDVALEAWKDWRSSIAAQVVNIEADLGRVRKEVDERFDAERHERIVAIRWAIGVAIPMVLSVVGLIVSRL